jgi:thiosulfate reductase cytochrome b subunit
MRGSRNSAGGPTQERSRSIHPPIVRICHWLNALAIFVMTGSGWRIYNSSALFPDLLPFIPHQYTLGGDFELSFKLHGEPGLAGALLWHFAGMWLLVGNFLVYLAYGFASGRFRRTLLQIRPRDILRDVKAALTFRLAHEAGVYNAVQRVLYAGVLFAIALMIVSGLAIWKPVQFQELVPLLGGFQGARLVHFLGMSAIVLFVIVHVALVILVPRTLPPMIIGRSVGHGTAAGEGGD